MCYGRKIGMMLLVVCDQTYLLQRRLVVIHLQLVQLLRQRIPKALASKHMTHPIQEKVKFTPFANSQQHFSPTDIEDYSTGNRTQMSVIDREFI